MGSAGTLYTSPEIPGQTGVVPVIAAGCAGAAGLTVTVPCVQVVVLHVPAARM